MKFSNKIKKLTNFSPLEKQADSTKANPKQ